MAEFHLFPCLPFELRARIWELTVEPRTVEIRIHRRNWPTPIQTMTSSTPVPAVLHACHESRTQGLYQRAFTLAIEGHEPRYVWVNFEVDMISIGDTEFENINAAERLLIRRLRFERENDDSFFYFDSHRLQKWYSNVEELHVICPDEGGAYTWHDCWEGCPWPCPTENIRFIDKGTGIRYAVGLGRTDLAELNPCPLNVCCNVWGQCGTTEEFCTVYESETGAPGTSQPGKNGCISSCGRDIIKGDAPSEKIQVAYFEAWNTNRKCLAMYVGQVDTDKYTHIHFAFADVTEGFRVDVSSVQEQFDPFKGMIGIKKIISFGGWDFSTKPGMFNILREAVKPANRDTFQRNLIDFANEHDLHGIDLDWEYPGAADIPGDGGLEIRLVCGPASYHYLKSFPKKKMGEDLDYVIYMTYDLHGQWDYNNPWTSSGCPTGNCLRSHVNETETRDALSMITKAGVPSNKVVVGVASYGRSFNMAEARCTGPMCKFTGTASISDAAAGRCTETGSYISNAEIKIIQSGNVNKQWKEEGSNILVYNETEWVAYMDDEMKAARTEFYDSYNFAGTTDWAVDLQEFVDGSGPDDYPDDYEYDINLDLFPECTDTYTTFQELEENQDSIPAHCMEQYIIQVEIAVMEGALNRYTELLEDGYDEEFKIYEEYVEDQVQPQLDAFMRSDEAQNYFTCTETGMRSCCESCSNPYCIINCSDAPDCVANDRWVTEDIDCPTGFDDDNAINATFTLIDPEGFYQAIYEEYGIEESWVKFDRRKVTTSQGCNWAGEDVLECQDRYDNFFHNYPTRNDENFEVYNPKDLIGESYEEARDLLRRFRAVRDFTLYDELMPWSDLVDAGSLPALAFQAAVKGMDSIVEAADEIEEQLREQMILGFVTGLLFFIPFVGEAVGAAGLLSARTLLRLVGAAGETGLLVYDVVENPDGAFMAVFSYLAGAGLGRAAFRDAADARRAMTSKDLNSLGSLKTNLDLIDSLRVGACRA